MEEYIVEPKKIADYVAKNTSKSNPFQARFENAFLNAQINNKELLKIHDVLKRYQNPNFDNSKSFVSILGLYNTVKELQDNDCLAIVAYSRFRKDENLFKMISEKFLKDCPTFFNLASGEGIKEVIDDENRVNNISFNIYLVYYSDYSLIIKEMTNEDMLAGSELEVQKNKVSKLLTVVKPARINVYFRDIPVMFIGTTDRTDENAAFSYGFTIVAPPIGQTIQDVNSFTDYGAMRFLTYDSLKDDEDGHPTSFCDCYVNTELCVVMENYCSTKIIYMDRETKKYTDSPFIRVAEGSRFDRDETYYCLKDGIYYTQRGIDRFQPGVDYYVNEKQCMPVMLISRLFRKDKTKEPWVNIEFGTTLNPLIPISVITHGTWYIFPWPLREPIIWGFTKDFAVREGKLYVAQEGAYVTARTETVIDVSDLRVILTKLLITAHQTTEPTSWGSYVDAEMIGQTLYLQRDYEVSVAQVVTVGQANHSHWVNGKVYFLPEDAHVEGTTLYIDAPGSSVRQISEFGWQFTIPAKTETLTFYKIKLSRATIENKWHKLWVKAPVDKVEKDDLVYYSSYSTYTKRKSIGYLGSRYLDGSWCLYPTLLPVPRNGNTKSAEVKPGNITNKLCLVEDTVYIENIDDDYCKLVVPAFRDFKVKGFSEYFLNMTDVLNSEFYYSVYDGLYNKDMLRWYILPTVIENSPYGNTRTAEVRGTTLRLESDSITVVNASRLGYKKLLVKKIRESKKPQETDYSKSFVEMYDYLRFLFYVPLED